MSDLVKRLREFVKGDDGVSPYNADGPLVNEAADKIERLESDIEALKRSEAGRDRQEDALRALLRSAVADRDALRNDLDIAKRGIPGPIAQQGLMFLSMRARAEEADSEISRLHARLDAEAQAAGTLQRKLNSAEEGIERLHAEVVKLKSVPMKYRRMEFNARLQKECKALEAERDALREVLSELVNACDEETPWRGWSKRKLVAWEAARNWLNDAALGKESK